MKIKKSLTVSFQRIAVIALGIAAISACNSGQQGPGMGGAPEYAVMTMETVPTELSSSYPATIRGRQDIEIRPNVGGFITKLSVDEGSVVRKGQELFQIDPVQYEEAVNVARAAVEVASASVSTAKLTAENKRRLAEKNIISEYEMQMAENALASQEAALAQARAQLVNAEKNLSYTKVTSPSDGVVGTIPFRVGSLVGPSMAVPLTTVSDISRMYVYFSMNEKDILNLARQGSGVLETMPQVQLKLADGTLYPETGRIETISGVIDPTTGAATVRAAFSNPDKVLRSGSSGVIMIPVKNDSSIVIPQKATYEIQDKRFVFMVTDSSTVQSTEVEILPINDGQQFIVTAGLKPGDRIVVEGVGTSVRNGMAIKPITPAESAAKLRGATQQAASSGEKK